MLHPTNLEEEERIRQLIVLPDEVLEACREVRARRYEVYVVGGGVRDSLMGRPVLDWDLTTSAEPERIQGIFRRTIPTGIAHGTVTVLLAGDHSIEVTTFRGDGQYSDGRRPDQVTFLNDLNEDLRRRDFTINAIAWDPISGRLFDPFDGCRDIRRRVIRCVGDPAKRFLEDGLRVLRALRFAATLGFSIDRRTLKAIPAAGPVLSGVAAERVREELLKILGAPTPAAVLRLMYDLDIMRILFPDVDQDLYTGAFAYLAVCDALCADPLLRLAALIRAGGEDQDTEVSSRPAASERGVRLGRYFADRLRFSRKARTRLLHLLEHADFDLEIVDPGTLRRLTRRIGRETLLDLVALRRQEARASHGDSDGVAFDHFVARLQVALDGNPPLSLGDLAVDGDFVLDRVGWSPGRWVGEILENLLDRVLGDPQLNHRDTLGVLIDTIVSDSDGAGVHDPRGFGAER